MSDDGQGLTDLSYALGVFACLLLGLVIGLVIDNIAAGLSLSTGLGLFALAIALLLQDRNTDGDDDKNRAG